MGKIELDFEKAKSQANDLDNVASQLRRLSNNSLNGTINGIQQAWKSDSSGKFCSKARTVQSELISIASELEKAASAIRTTAKAIYDAEKQAEEIARQRAYNNGGGGAW